MFAICVVWNEKYSELELNKCPLSPVTALSANVAVIQNILLGQKYKVIEVLIANKIIE